MPQRRIKQSLFKGASYNPDLIVDVVDPDEGEEWGSSLNDLREDEQKMLGLAILFTDQCYIEYVAFATSNRVVVLRAPPAGWHSLPHDDNWLALRDLLESKNDLRLVGIDLAQIALAFHRESEFRLRGIDLGLAAGQPGLLPGALVLKLLEDDVVGEAYQEVWRQPPTINGVESDASRTNWIALRAWMTIKAAESFPSVIEKSKFVDTSPTEDLSKEDLDILATVQLQYDLLNAASPDTRGADIKKIQKTDDGVLALENLAYKSKIRKGTQQKVIIRRGETIVGEGKVTDAKGKQTQVRMDKLGTEAEFEDPDVEFTVETLGREDLTTADVARSEYLLHVLQGIKTLRASKFSRIIWFPTDEDKENLKSMGGNTFTNDEEHQANDGPPTEAVIGGMLLNPSQALVAQTMLSEDHKFALVHGPPGTGKTRTIASVVKAWVEMGKTVYLVAQSNVGVKNIAEKLASENMFNFKLLVSSEFYDEWHEAIYNGLEANLVKSEELKPKAIKELFAGVPVVLSTVSMLYSPRLAKGRLFDLIPFERVIVDEASQIFVGDYLALFHKFYKTLDKVCWFGDPKQLPPHQRETIEGLDSIYDISHVRENSLLLDTQYRMPCPIGDFISSDRYLGQLKSVHRIKTFDCLKFVDVYDGQECKSGTSWINLQEARTVAHLVSKYYHDEDYCVITPYDPQRKEIEKALENSGFQGKGKCFNVDSFQGNEAPYIIISAVRTEAPGFLDLHNRVNVMLTRCKRGMVIVTNRRFVRVQARQTLVGKLADYWASVAPGKEETLWTDWVHVEEGTVDLPGVMGLPPRPPTPPAKKVVPPTGFFNATPTGPVFGVAPSWPRTPANRQPSQSPGPKIQSWGSPSVSGGSSTSSSTPQRTTPLQLPNTDRSRRNTPKSSNTRVPLPAKTSSVVQGGWRERPILNSQRSGRQPGTTRPSDTSQREQEDQGGWATVERGNGSSRTTR